MIEIVYTQLILVKSNDDYVHILDKFPTLEATLKISLLKSAMFNFKFKPMLYNFYLPNTNVGQLSSLDVSPFKNI